MTSVSDSVRDAASQIKIRNVWYLLLYAWDMGDWLDRWKSTTESSPSLLGLLARILAESTRKLLRNQLGRAYAERRDTIPGVRGRIDFAMSLKHRTFERAAAHCAFSELSVDTLKNRIIRGTLHRLASDPHLKHRNAERETALRHELRTLVRSFEDVSLIPVHLADFGRLQLSRNDRAYALPLSICALVQRMQMPTEAEGDHALVALLKDKIEFHRLFERFVQNFYHFHLKDDFDVVSQKKLEWHDVLHSPLVPSMFTDITLIAKQPPHRRLVIDTKYSISTLSDRMKFKSENLYQIYAYLRTQEHLDETHRHAEGILIYPTTTYQVDGEMLVQGHRIRVVSVNLADDWEAIEKHLLDLVKSERPTP